MFRTKKKAVLENNNNLSCWFKNIVTFIIFNLKISLINKTNDFAKYYIENANKELITSTKKFNEFIFNLIIKSYYYKNNKIFENQLIAYSDKCYNLPYFELFFIELLKQLDIKVMSAICLRPSKSSKSKVYYNFHKYYCYEMYMAFSFFRASER